MPKFSILLPTHNRPEVLEFAIRSVLAQTLDDWELLVVGDGCTDRTAALVAGFGDPRIRWFDLPKAPGFGYANRNVALGKARGELIAFLGHDNLLLPDHLERMAVPFVAPATMFAYSRPVFVHDNGVLLPFFVNLTIQPVLHDFMTRRNVLPATTIVHRRSVFDQVGMWPEALENAGDWDLWKRIIQANGKRCIRVVRDATCLHFRADWRLAKGWAPAPLTYLTQMQEAGRFWPEALDLKLGPDSLPQAQVWAALAADREGFGRAIRAGCTVLQEYLAWNAGLDPAFR